MRRFDHECPRCLRGFRQYDPKEHELVCLNCGGTTYLRWTVRRNQEANVDRG